MQLGKLPWYQSMTKFVNNHVLYTREDDLNLRKLLEHSVGKYFQNTNSVPP